MADASAALERLLFGNDEAEAEEDALEEDLLNLAGDELLDEFLDNLEPSAGSSQQIVSVPQGHERSLWPLTGAGDFLGHSAYGGPLPRRDFVSDFIQIKHFKETCLVQLQAIQAAVDSELGTAATPADVSCDNLQEQPVEQKMHEMLHADLQVLYADGRADDQVKRSPFPRTRKKDTLTDQQAEGTGADATAAQANQEFAEQPLVEDLSQVPAVSLGTEVALQETLIRSEILRQAEENCQGEPMARLSQVMETLAAVHPIIADIGLSEVGAGDAVLGSEQELDHDSLARLLESAAMKEGSVGAEALLDIELPVQEAIGMETKPNEQQVNAEAPTVEQQESTAVVEDQQVEARAATSPSEEAARLRLTPVETQTAAGVSRDPEPTTSNGDLAVEVRSGEVTTPASSPTQSFALELSERQGNDLAIDRRARSEDGERIGGGLNGVTTSVGHLVEATDTDAAHARGKSGEEPNGGNTEEAGSATDSGAIAGETKEVGVQTGGPMTGMKKSGWGGAKRARERNLQGVGAGDRVHGMGAFAGGEETAGREGGELAERIDGSLRVPGESNRAPNDAGVGTDTEREAEQRKEEERKEKQRKERERKEKQWKENERRERQRKERERKEKAEQEKRRGENEVTQICVGELATYRDYKAAMRNQAPLRCIRDTPSDQRASINYKRMHQFTKEEACPPWLDSVPQEAVIIVRVFDSTNRNSGYQEHLVLGSQRLTRFRDGILCPMDTLAQAAGVDNPSGYFLIEETFFDDMRRGPSAVRYSTPIVEWAAAQRPLPGATAPGAVHYGQKDMEQFVFEDLNVRVGAEYLYCHQGNCEHRMVFTDVRLLNRFDSLDVLAYPLLRYRTKYQPKKCHICGCQPASKLTVGDELVPESPCFFCDQCFGALHHTKTGELHPSDLEVYPYTPDM